MNFFEINRNPSTRQLRQFALASFLLPICCWGLGLGFAVVGGTTIACGLLFTGSLVAPRRVRPLFIASSYLTAPIGRVVGEVVLLGIFLGVFVPIAILFRITHRDSLQRRIDRQAQSYWQKIQPPRSVADFYRRY